MSGEPYARCQTEFSDSDAVAVLFFFTDDENPRNCWKVPKPSDKKKEEEEEEEEKETSRLQIVTN